MDVLVGRREGVVGHARDAERFQQRSRLRLCLHQQPAAQRGDARQEARDPDRVAEALLGQDK